MKKISTLIFFLFFLFIGVANAEELCNKYYKVNLDVEGKGSIDSDKEYTTDSTINIKCGENFVFEVKPDENYVLSGVYINGDHIIEDDSKKYGLYDINSNSNIKVIFKKLVNYPENELLFSSDENNISLFIDDLNEDGIEKNVIRLFLREIEVLLNKDFLSSSENNITLIADQVYKDDLSYKEQRVVKNSLYYNLEIHNGDSIVNDFKPITISIPYSRSKSVYVYKISKNGKLTPIKSDYDEEIVSFKIKESGLYTLSGEEQDTMRYFKNMLNFSHRQIISIISITFAVSLLLVLIIRKK